MPRPPPGQTSPSEITLVAVAKSGTPEAVRQLLEMGHQHIAESRVQQLQQQAAQIQEWLARRAAREPRARAVTPLAHGRPSAWRNKVKPVLQICRYIHSVDCCAWPKKFRPAWKRKSSPDPMQIFLEVNVSGEDGKYGVAVGAALHLAEQIDTMEGVQLVGLMTMAPITEKPEQARPYFAPCAEIFEEIRFRKSASRPFQAPLHGHERRF